MLWGMRGSSGRLGGQEPSSVFCNQKDSEYLPGDKLGERDGEGAFSVLCCMWQKMNLQAFCWQSLKKGPGKFLESQNDDKWELIMWSPSWLILRCVKYHCWIYRAGDQLFCILLVLVIRHILRSFHSAALTSGCLTQGLIWSLKFLWISGVFWTLSPLFQCKEE